MKISMQTSFKIWAPYRHKFKKLKSFKKDQAIDKPTHAIQKRHVKKELQFLLEECTFFK